MQTKLLAIYLNDHLAGATAGAAVAQRAASSNRDNDAYYPGLPAEFHVPFLRRRHGVMRM